MSADTIEKLRPAIVEQASGVVLEIGSGPGFNFPQYKNIIKLYALEPSRELIQESRKYIEDLPFPVEFLETGAEHIPLPDQSVDMVVSTWTMCSVNEPERVLQEISRVLKPNGRYVFIEHGVSPKPLLRSIQALLTPFSMRLTGNCHLNRDIKQLVENSGLAITKIEQFHVSRKPLVYYSQGIAAKET